MPFLTASKTSSLLPVLVIAIALRLGLVLFIFATFSFVSRLGKRGSLRLRRLGDGRLAVPVK